MYFFVQLYILGTFFVSYFTCCNYIKPQDYESKNPNCEIVNLIDLILASSHTNPVPSFCEPLRLHSQNSQNSQNSQLLHSTEDTHTFSPDRVDLDLNTRGVMFTHVAPPREAKASEGYISSSFPDPDLIRASPSSLSLCAVNLAFCQITISCDKLFISIPFISIVHFRHSTNCEQLHVSQSRLLG